MLLKRASIITHDNETTIVDILLENNKIKQIAPHIDIPQDEVIDLDGKLVISGAIDVHVHLREPGYEDKETIATGSAAAAHGGFTTILAMPNVNPHPDNVETLKHYQKDIDTKAVVNVIPYANITMNAMGKQLVDFDAIVKAGWRYFSDDGVGVQDEAMMEKAMRAAYRNNAIIVAHTEDNTYLKAGACVNEGIASKRLGLVGIPNACEYAQVKRDLALALKTKAAYHICHMSTKESVAALREARAAGANVSGEVTTHHLLLNEEDVTGTLEKMNPPLRSRADQQALIEGIKDGTIKIIANDHAPHTVSDKAKPMNKAPFGIVSLETSLALTYTELVDKDIISKQHWQELISYNPAQRFGLKNKGLIAEGYDADITVLETDIKAKIDIKQFVSKGINTPFNQRIVNCQVYMCIVNGKIVYNLAKEQSDER